MKAISIKLKLQLILMVTIVVVTATIMMQSVAGINNMSEQHIEQYREEAYKNKEIDRKSVV